MIDDKTDVIIVIAVITVVISVMIVSRIVHHSGSRAVVVVNVAGRIRVGVFNTAGM